MDELLEAVALQCDTSFLSKTVCPLLRVEQPPKLQCLIRTITARLKSIGKIENEFKHESYHQIVENTLNMTDMLTEVSYLVW